MGGDRYEGGDGGVGPAFPKLSLRVGGGVGREPRETREWIALISCLLYFFS